MIPESRSDLDPMVAEARRQLEEAEQIFSSHPSDVLLRRPDETKWSIAGHLTHLCLVNEAYLATIEDEVGRSRARGRPESDGPYRHPMFGSWFARSMEPPPKRRLKTLKSMVPDPAIEPEDALDRFRSAQGRLVESLDRSRGLDLGRIRFGSPFMRLIRLSLGTALELLLAHNRRHLWLIREVLGHVAGSDEGASGPSG